MKSGFMKISYSNVSLLLLLSFTLISVNSFAQNYYDKIIEKDWLVHPVTQKVEIIKDGKDLILYNGLVKRAFRISPNVACYDYKNLSTGQQLLRAVQPEAKVTINGKLYNIGGLHGQKERAYLLPEWLDALETEKEDFAFTDYKVSAIEPFINWKNTTWSMNKKQATGKRLSLNFVSELPELKGLEVTVNYELYDGIPLIVKWVSITNNAKKAFIIDRVVNESLAVVEEESAVVGSPEEMKKQHGIYVETNYAFNNAMRYDISDQTTHWLTDSAYTSQVNYNLKTPCLLEYVLDL
jgi:hypothetical protein